MARAIAGAIAPAIAEAMAEGIGGSNGQAKPLPIPLVTVVCGVYGSDQIQSHRYLGSLAAPIGFGVEQ